MLTAIHFDHQFPLATCEVHEVWADRQLANEFVLVEPPAAQFGPEPIFRVIVGLTQ